MVKPLASQVKKKRRGLDPPRVFGPFSVDFAMSQLTKGYGTGFCGFAVRIQNRDILTKANRASSPTGIEI